MVSKYGRFGKYKPTEDDDDRFKPKRKLPPSTGDEPISERPIPSMGRGSLGPESMNESLEFIDEPELYSGVGKDRKINPKYDTSIGQDALAGGAMAVRQRTGNPFYDIGLALGGLGGGALNKNLRGKQEHSEDVTRIREQNKQIEFKSQATIRAEAMVEQRKQRQRQLEIAEQRELRLQEMATERDKTKRIKIAGESIQQTQGPDRRYFQVEHAKLAGHPDPENVDNDYMVGWGQKTFGDVVFNTNKSGEIKEATDAEGNVITNMSLSKWVDTLAKVNKLDATTDKESITKAYGEAQEILAPHKPSFKTATGKFNPVQYNAQVLNIANKILSGQKNNPEGKATIPDELMVDGVTIPINIPLLNVGQRNESAPQQKSPFMPPISEQAPPIYDATNQPQVETLGGTTTTETPSGNNEYPLSFTNPDTGKAFKGREITPPSALANKKVKEGTRIQSKDGKTALVFLGGAWYEIKL